MNIFTKLHEPLNQVIRPLNLGGRKRLVNMDCVSSHIDLKNRVSHFWHMPLFFFSKRIKLEKEKIELLAKKMNNFFN